jgi:hypothetical protein
LIFGHCKGWQPAFSSHWSLQKFANSPQWKLKLWVPLKFHPIFDTNIFGLRDQSALRDWRFLLQHRPSHGWPLSLITALELLAGLDGIPSEKYGQLREQVQLAFDLSKGRVLDDPMPMLCREVFHVPFPDRLVAPPGRLLKRYMDMVRRANSSTQLLRGVPYQGFRASMSTVSAVNDLVSNLKKQWVNALQSMATAKNPEWRELFSQQGRRLGPEMRREIDAPSAWKTEQRLFVEALLRDLLDAKPAPALTNLVMNKFSAVLEFSTFVVRAFLTGNYSIEKHSSDVFDQFQLRYLGMERFLIVTADPDLSGRTAQSPQSARIMSFQDFLATL